MTELRERRAFLSAALAASVGWVVADLVQVEEALAWAAQQTSAVAPRLNVLSREQAAVLDAMASRILPSIDGRPGAREAGAVYFIDRALDTFNASQKDAYAAGVADLDYRAAEVWKGRGGFSALAPERQDTLLVAIERSRFFEAVRFDTIVGTFALPSWGGNRDHAGWRLIGFEHQPRFQAPFGHYDADLMRRG